MPRTGPILDYRLRAKRTTSCVMKIWTKCVTVWVLWLPFWDVKLFWHTELKRTQIDYKKTRKKKIDLCDTSYCSDYEGYLFVLCISSQSYLKGNAWSARCLQWICRTLNSNPFVKHSVENINTNISIHYIHFTHLLERYESDMCCHQVNYLYL